MVGLWGSVENDFNFSTCLSYFIIKCWKETNGSAQSVNQKKPRTRSLASVCTLGGGEGASKAQTAGRELYTHHSSP